MSAGLKRYELTLEVNSVEGSQVFACVARSEFEAQLKLSRGECEIIDQSLEVLGLDKEPIEVVESNDISSRLLSDLFAEQSTELEQLRKERDELVLWLRGLQMECVENDSPVVNTEVFINSRSALTKIEVSK